MAPQIGVQQVTPEAVLHRYLTLVNAESVDLGQFVRLVGLDADLLARWLRLLNLEVSPRSLKQGIDALENWTFIDLAQAQAWAVLPPGDSVRLSFRQWRLVLRNACLAEQIALHLQLGDVESVRWRIHLAISGVMLPNDPLLCSLIEFRGTRPELLEDARVEQKILALIDGMDGELLDANTDPADATDRSDGYSAAGPRTIALAKQLLGIAEHNFSSLVQAAERACAEHIEAVGLTETLQSDWGEDLWTLQQVNLMAGLFLQSSDLTNIYEAHALAAKTLFRLPPTLFLLDQSSRTLISGLSDGHAIPIGSISSGIAKALREKRDVHLSDVADAAVADRQMLRTMQAERALATPLVVAGDGLGVLLFAEDEDVDQRFATEAYAGALARWLSASQDSAIDGMRLLSNFREQEEKRLREIVHEANNPLSIVNNYLHILELRLQHEPQALEQLRLISREIRRATELIQTAREVPKATDVETATAQLQYSNFDVNHVVRQIFEVHQGYADNHESSLRLELHQGALNVRSDEQRVIQILNNLVKNAIEATSGGDGVRLSTRGGVFRQGQEGVEVVVQDSGPGLSREVLAKLYEPKQSSKGGDHAGLGLHIVHRLVNEVQSSIDVRTGTGQGTAFTLFLPILLD